MATTKKQSTPKKKVGKQPTSRRSWKLILSYDFRKKVIKATITSP
jgi:hypothetical protein